MSGGVISSRQFQVNATPTLLAVGNAGGSQLHLHSDGNNSKDILIGPANVTPSTGFLVQKGDEFTIYLPEGAYIYGVSSDGSQQKIYVLQTGGI